MNEAKSEPLLTEEQIADIRESTEPESIRRAMEDAWKDHQHTRDQTWKALTFVVGIGAGVVVSTWQSHWLPVKIVADALLFLVALCGAQITYRHRNTVEITKFRHIAQCEEALGLTGVITGVKMPREITPWDVFLPWKGNTALFILRMNFSIMLFAVFLLIWHTRPPH